MFEVGQEVAIRSGYGYPTFTRAVVEKVTPSGQVILVGGRRFRANGVEFTSGSYRANIEPMTPAIAERIRRKELIDTLRGMDWTKQTTALLEEVVALVYAVAPR